MDYEKKDFRKLYEDLVKSDWFKKAYHDKSLGDCPFDIPELTESEDERMLKGLIQHLKELRDWEGGTVPPIKLSSHYEAWITCLEKQKAPNTRQRLADAYEVIIALRKENETLKKKEEAK